MSEPIKYILYARKSTDSEDRQVQSLDDQVNKLEQLAKSQGLKIIDTYRESKSAKKPCNRPMFTEMIKRVRNGEADGVLCWHLNRLSRNPMDSGELQWMLQSRVINCIQTYEKAHRPDDNALLFSVESGMANQFIQELSKNVKRGIQSKLDKGWRPGMAPLGYLNEPRDHTIIVDPERFPLIRRAWDLILTGNYTVPQVLNKLNNEWGFRTLKKKRVGNRPMTMSGLYLLFNNMFYTGLIPHKDKIYQGKHTPMITMEEFDRVQEILGKKGKPRPKKHEFAFTGMMKCGHCGCTITAETKHKLIKSTKERREYTYYHCTWQKADIECHQPSISDKELERQAMEILKNMDILPEFKDWALGVIRDSNDEEIMSRKAINDSLASKLADLQSQLDNLTRMRYRDQIGDEEFSREKTEIQKDIAKTRNELAQIDKRTNDWIDLTEKAFVFATRAREAFQNGDMETKRIILRTVGLELIIKDKKLEFKPKPWFEIIDRGCDEQKALLATLEPEVLGQDKRKTADFSAAFPSWHGR